MTLKFDKIGYWSEVKLDIVREYAGAYAKILASQRGLSSSYIDGFSGAGKHVKKSSKESVPGSPINVLAVDPPFDHYFFIDLNEEKVEHLQALVGDRDDVSILCGDCNPLLLNHVFPRTRFEDYRRGLCLLDPYGLHLQWEVMHAAGQSGSIDLILNFPILDMNRNALWRDPDRRPIEDCERMTAFWGDESWRQILYRPKPQLTIFGQEEEKVSNNEVATAFQERLRQVAGFKYVPDPMPMRNDSGGIVYYLFFASQKAVAERIFKAIKRKHEKRRS